MMDLKGCETMEIKRIIEKIKRKIMKSHTAERERKERPEPLPKENIMSLTGTEAARKLFEITKGMKMRPYRTWDEKIKSIAQYSRKNEEEVRHLMREAAKAANEVFEAARKEIIAAGEKIKKEIKCARADEWQRKKMRKPNNERRRKGEPLVRRRTHLQARKNERHKKK